MVLEAAATALGGRRGDVYLRSMLRRAPIRSGQFLLGKSMPRTTGCRWASYMTSAGNLSLRRHSKSEQVLRNPTPSCIPRQSLRGGYEIEERAHWEWGRTARLSVRGVPGDHVSLPRSQGSRPNQLRREVSEREHDEMLMAFHIHCQLFSPFPS